MYFYRIFTKNVLKTLLRGNNTTRKIYQVVCEIFFSKYMIFIQKNQWKKMCAFWKKKTKKNEFFIENVFKIFLRGRETRKSYCVVFEKFPKTCFFRLPWPVHYLLSIHQSKQAGFRLGSRRAGILRLHIGKDYQISKKNRTNLRKNEKIWKKSVIFLCKI